MKYWIKVGRTIRGPFTETKLKSLAQKGELRRTHYLTTDQQNWIPAGHLSQLKFAENVLASRRKRPRRPRELSEMSAATRYARPPKNSFMQNGLYCGHITGYLTFLPAFFVLVWIMDEVPTEEREMAGFGTAAYGAGFVLGIPLGILLRILGINVPSFDAFLPWTEQNVHPAADFLARWSARFLVLLAFLAIGGMLYGIWLLLAMIYRDSPTMTLVGGALIGFAIIKVLWLVRQ